MNLRLTDAIHQEVDVIKLDTSAGTSRKPNHVGGYDRNAVFAASERSDSEAAVARPLLPSEARAGDGAKCLDHGHGNPKVTRFVTALKALRAGVIGGLLLSSFSNSTQAQVSLIEGEFANTQTAARTELGIRRGSLIVAPIPFSNPTIGNGLTLGAGYLFTLSGSKPSGAGVAKLKTSNGSEGFGGGFSLSFAGGKWSVGVFGAQADLFYDFPLGKSAHIPIKQSGEAIALRVERGFSEAISAGVSLTHLNSTIGLDIPGLGGLPPILRPDAELTLGKVGIDITFDTRNDTFYPTEGTLIAGSISYGAEIDSIFGGQVQLADRNYTKGLFSAAKYAEIGERGVIAAKISVCGSSDTAPFFDSCGVGLANGLRGFGALDDIEPWSAGLQVEYRGRFSDRFGFVTFAGLGGGGKSLVDLSLNRGGGAVGAGIRFRVSQKFGLDYAVDYARNDAREDFLYITLGQRF